MFRTWLPCGASRTPPPTIHTQRQTNTRPHDVRPIQDRHTRRRPAMVNPFTGRRGRRPLQFIHNVDQYKTTQRPVNTIVKHDVQPIQASYATFDQYKTAIRPPCGAFPNGIRLPCGASRTPPPTIHTKRPTNARPSYTTTTIQDHATSTNTIVIHNDRPIQDIRDVRPIQDRICRHAGRFLTGVR